MIKAIYRNKLMALSVLILTLWTAAGIAGPFFAPYSYDEADQDARFQAPDAAHPMGTDIMGRDVLSRILFGARISLLVGLLTAFVSVIIGTLYGTISGYYGGWLDSLMMRIVDIIYGLPYIIFVIILMVLIGRGISNIFIALIAVMWLTMARIVRGQVLSIKEKEYIEAARALGVNSSRIVFRHIIPNITGVILIYAAIIVQEVILYESFLSFLGLGIQAPMCSWGSLTKDGVDVIMTGTNLWILVFPAGCLCLVLLALNILSDKLRDKLT